MKQISQPGDRVHDYLVTTLGFKTKDLLDFFGLPRSTYYKSIGNLGLSLNDARVLASKFDVSVDFLFPLGFYCPDDFPAEDIDPIWPKRLAGQSFEEYCDKAPPVRYCLKHWLKIQEGKMVANRVPQALAYYGITLRQLAVVMGVTRVRRQLSTATNYGAVEAIKLYAGLRTLVDISFYDLFPVGCIEPLAPTVQGYRHRCAWGYLDMLHAHDVSECTGAVEVIPQDWQSVIDAKGHQHVATLKYLLDTQQGFEQIRAILSDLSEVDNVK